MWNVIHVVYIVRAHVQKLCDRDHVEFTKAFAMSQAASDEGGSSSGTQQQVSIIRDSNRYKETRAKVLLVICAVCVATMNLSQGYFRSANCTTSVK